MSAFVYRLPTAVVQTYLNDHGADLKVDGVSGPKTYAAVKALILKEPRFWEVKTSDDKEQYVAINQSILKDAGLYRGAIDGLAGPDTSHAIENFDRSNWRDRQTVSDTPASPTEFPTYSGLTDYYGKAGYNISQFVPPYPMVLAWDTFTPVRTIRMHSRCIDSAKAAMQEVLDVYGVDQIRLLRLDRFGGCLASPPRPMRGGAQPSTHNWGVAIDFDPERNQLKWGADRAEFALPIYTAFLDAWTKRGWVSLGRVRNYDWMHLQAVRL